MFGRSKPVIFEPYGRRRSRGLLPRWLWLLLLGAVAGAGAVIYVQQRHLPPRLSSAESSRLTEAYDRADAERTRMTAELAQTTRELEAALALQQGQAEQLATSRATTEGLKQDLAWVVDALPPDPRDGLVQVRAASFSARGGTLAYDVLLTRARAGAQAMSGLVQLTVAGASAGSGETSVALKPIALSMGEHHIVRGSATLPNGFKPAETTIRIVDQPTGRTLGGRVIRVR